MSQEFPTSDSLDPQSGYTPKTPASQAANDLRTAAGEKARDFAHTAESKVAELKDRAVESAQHLRDAAGERVNQFKTTATVRADALKHAATDQWDESRLKAKEFQVTAEDYIRQNPTKCVISALGVGFLIGLITRR